MLLGDWLILFGVILLTIGLTGLTLETGRSAMGSDPARSDPWRRTSIMASVHASLLRWRPGSGWPAAPGTTAAGRRIDSHDLTDLACRLADGSMGRVAIIPGTDEDWTAVCVPA